MGPICGESRRYLARLKTNETWSGAEKNAVLDKKLFASKWLRKIDQLDLVPAHLLKIPENMIKLKSTGSCSKFKIPGRPEKL